MLDINISRIGPGQAEEFFKLYKNVALADFSRWTKESKEKWFNEDYSLKFWRSLLMEGKLPVFVAKDGKKMAGYALIEGLNFGVAYLGWVGVLKEYQGEGLGSRLLDEVEKWCKNNRIHKIELETQEPELQKFYKKNNFKLEGVRKNSWQHLDNYMFGKEIN